MKTSHIALRLMGQAAVGFGLGLAAAATKASASIARKIHEPKQLKEHKCKCCQHNNANHTQGTPT
jgi:hypothetical protein